MPELQVSVVLPYYLRLDEGDYQTSKGGDVVQIVAPLLMEGVAPRTPVRARIKADDSQDPEEIRRRQVSCGDRLLRAVNRLLRWYRTVSRRADVIELTRAQVSPFQFEAVGGTPPPEPEWLEPLEHRAAGPQPAAHALDQKQLTRAVRDGLQGGDDPDVADLFLLDAERALYHGRFRETVLFCWSTIDSVFNRKYDALVDRELAGEWGQGREFFKGPDFGLRKKMTAGMYLLAKRSLFREESGTLWQNLSTSYNMRNAIIHDGENATEDDANQAIDVARRIVQIMGEV